MRYSGTSPLGHLYSGDTEFGLGKMFILIFHSNSTSIKGTPLVYSEFTCPGPEGVPWMEVPLYKQVKTKYRGGGGGGWFGELFCCHSDLQRHNKERILLSNNLRTSSRDEIIFK